LTYKTKNMKISYVKEEKKPVKENGKIVGHNIVHVAYDKNDKVISEKIIIYIKKTK